MNSFEEAKRLHEITSRYEHENRYEVPFSLEIASQEALWILESHRAQAKALTQLREAGEWVLNIVNGVGRGGGSIDPDDDEPEAAFDALKAALRGEERA